MPMYKDKSARGGTGPDVLTRRQVENASVAPPGGKPYANPKLRYMNFEPAFDQTGTIRRHIGKAFGGGGK